MRSGTVTILMATVLFVSLLSFTSPALAAEDDDCPGINGDSTNDRNGCPDTDGDGWSDPDGSSHEALLATCEYLKHDVKDWERPDTLAHKYYGDSELHWIILFANGNQIQYPWYDWSLTQYDLTKFVTKKYGAANINAIHHYEDSDNYQVDSTAPIANAITNFVHEEKVNDAKRTIRIMQPQYVDLVVDEFKRLMAQQ